jgi:ribonuclease HI
MFVELSFVLWFDGGSKHNQTPEKRQGYGSYLVECDEIMARWGSSLEFGAVTSNEAEYRTLFTGLEDLLNDLYLLGFGSDDVVVEIRGDSLLVLNQVRSGADSVRNHTGPQWKCKAQHLQPLRDRVRNQLKQFKSYQLVKASRSEIVEKLGH